MGRADISDVGPALILDILLRFGNRAKQVFKNSLFGRQKETSSLSTTVHSMRQLVYVAALIPGNLLISINAKANEDETANADYSNAKGVYFCSFKVVRRCV